MSNDNRVTVVDIQIPFWSMVILMVKAAIAAIPALFILTLLAMLFSSIMTGLFGGAMVRGI
ncbi:MAG: hypothetical protein EOM91_11980 [Sphingobacteriia bacterium]|nr:hypothetical protein [Sphingobacteriia bacterium]NCC39378.1 hypothetical protein [Gammaproteobacteria bacterium]